MLAADKIFREYDIRGEVGLHFDSEFAFALGRAYAGMVKDRTGKDAPTVAVGRDCRLTGEEISEQLIKGICQEGVSVVRTGMGPTPQLYFSVFSKDLDGGVQVTASHNPAPDNGFKIMVGKNTLKGSDIQELRERVHALGALDEASTKGGVEDFDAPSAYLAEMLSISKPSVGSSKKLKLVVDGGNGAGGPVGVKLLRDLGCEVVELYTEPDGRFPNHHPDPTVLENIAELREKVVQEGADAGIAWDGDADRIGVVDERGEVVWGDMLLVVFGQQLAKEVENPIVIGDVKCSQNMFDALRAEGCDAVMWKTGHSLIKAKLKELGAHLAGEMSGHMFFSHRYFGFDDALHSSARLVEILSNTEKSLSQLLETVPQSVSTPEIRVDCPDEVKFEVVSKAQKSFSDYEVNELDGARISFEHGWGLVRASNTQPALVLRFEADSSENLEQYQGIVRSKLDEILASVG